MKYCSQCKKSQYVKSQGKTLLRCAEFSHPERDNEETLPHENDELLPPCWAYATHCPFFVPEKREYRTRNMYKSVMHRCGISMREEKTGILAHVKLR